MSTLQEAIQQKRASEPPPSRSCGSAKEPGRALQIHSWHGEKWVLPWSHFGSAWHHGTGKDEELVLLFASHEVVLHGVRLGLLLSEIASLNLEYLRDMPPDFRGKADENEPYIGRIDVRCLSDFPAHDIKTPA